MSYIGNSPTNIAFQTDTFSGTGSKDPDKDPLTYDWYEGNVKVGTGETLKVKLPKGSQTIELRASDGKDGLAVNFFEDSSVVATLGGKEVDIQQTTSLPISTPMDPDETTILIQPLVGETATFGLRVR
jgi:hypothetical protein